MKALVRSVRRRALPPRFWIFWGALVGSFREGPGAGIRRWREGRATLPRWQRLERREPEGPIALPRCTSPRVSIVIPAHDQWVHTGGCLRSIGRCSDSAPYEVIVVDNASRDGTSERLAEAENVTVVSPGKNLGYVGGCNAGAAAAKGELLLFLNNDTRVTPGWLDQLVGVLDADGSIGVVGPKLLFPNGRLQELGCEVGRDGRAVNLGKFDDPWREPWRERRDVDYVSGAALLIRRDLFEELGGFDERFSPGFWEDADLCFRAAERGLRIVAEPASIVFHFEGSSNWRAASEGSAWGPESNAHLFQERWRERLERQPAGPSR